MSKIKAIKAREIKDSRGNPTVEVELKTQSGVFTASCPSGKSTGKNEADALPALQAIENINNIIAKKLKGREVEDQKILDETMIKLDNTENKSHLGANAILPVSVAICRAAAASEKLPLYLYIAKLSDVGPHSNLPLAMFNFIEGGAHAENDLDFQEFLVVPAKKLFSENLIIANGIFGRLKELLIKNYGQVLIMGDEGGFAPKISKTDQALFLLKNAIGNEDVKIAIDVAASQFYKDGKYFLEEKEFSVNNLVDFYKDLAQRFTIISIEDPFAEEDWQNFAKLVNELEKIIIVGDDLTTTNVKRIKEAHNKKSCNGVIIKPNQIGTVTEAIEAARLAKSYNWKVIVSHRSGETMDDFIADLAVGIGADFIKSGSPSQPERMAKYQRLLEIEKELVKK